MTTFWQSSTCLSINDSVSFCSRAFPRWFSHLWPSLLPNIYLLLLQTWLQWIRNRLYKFCDEIKIPLGFFKIPNLPSSKRKKNHLTKIFKFATQIKDSMCEQYWKERKLHSSVLLCWDSANNGCPLLNSCPRITLLAYYTATLSRNLCNRSSSAPCCQWRNGES